MEIFEAENFQGYLIDRLCELNMRHHCIKIIASYIIIDFEELIFEAAVKLKQHNFWPSKFPAICDWVYKNLPSTHKRHIK